MSDREASHLVSELQEARAEVDRLRAVVREYQRQAAQLVERVVELDSLRWRDARSEPPTEPGIYLATCRKNFGCWEKNSWEEGRWEIEPVDYWRPIGSLPKESE